jgi:hypothetical protein
MARDYKKKRGGFDEGFYDQLAEWSARNPLFSNADTQKARRFTPAGGNSGFRVLGVEGQ